MNKFLKITGMVAALVAVMILGVVVTGVSAQGPATPDSPGGGGQIQRGNGTGTGLGVIAVDEADMHAAIADVLGLRLDKFEVAVAEGKTPAILAQELGIDLAIVQAAMDAVHLEAMQQVVDDGLIPQEQADWILGHRGGQNGQGNGLQSDGMSRGMGRMGQGPGGNAGSGSGGGDCIYDTP